MGGVIVQVAAAIPFLECVFLWAMVVWMLVVYLKKRGSN